MRLKRDAASWPCTAVFAGPDSASGHQDKASDAVFSVKHESPVELEDGRDQEFRGETAYGGGGSVSLRWLESTGRAYFVVEVFEEYTCLATD